MADVTLTAGADSFTGTGGDDAVVATSSTLGGSDKLIGGGQAEADILEIRRFNKAIDDTQFAGVREFENIEITDTITATIRLTLGANAAAAFSYAAGGSSTFAPKALVNASNLTSLQKFILNASGWSEPAGTVDRGLRVSLGAGANDVISTAYDDRILIAESSWGSNDKIDAGAGFDVLVVRDNSSRTINDALFATLTSVEMLRLGDFLPGAHSTGSFRVVLGAQSQAAGLTQIDSRFNEGSLNIDASARTQALAVFGAFGGDTILGSQAADVIRGNSGNDFLYGKAGNDSLAGNTGNDRLNGESGDDRMAGGAGNDTYFVDSIGDKVTENSNAGFDRVYSTLDFSLGNGLERLDLLGANHVNGLGNGLANIIVGNSGDNQLSGGSGNDMLSGGGGDDSLIGGAGDDKLNGGPGDDVLVIDKNDSAMAIGGAGLDTINLDAFGTSLSYAKLDGTVFDEVERIDLTGKNDNFLILDPTSIGSATILVKGDLGDAVVINGAWVKGGSVVNPGGVVGTFDIYNNGGATVQIETDVVVYGSTFDLSTLNGKTGFRLVGEQSYDGLGYSVAAAGDVNGDGFEDIIVGAYFANAGGVNSGAAYVIYGAAGGFPTSIELSALNGTVGFRLQGADTGHQAGYSVSSTGDFNGDGFADLVIGAPGADFNSGPASGAAYVVFGKAGSFGASFDLTTLDGKNGFALVAGDAGSLTGISVSGAGDVNGDGFDDVIIGASSYNVASLTKAGAAFILFGTASAMPTTIDLTMLDGNDGVQLLGVDTDDFAGRSVSAAGDINGDGFDDVIVGAYGTNNGADSNAGAAYVVFGKAGGWGATLELSTLNGGNGFKLVGTTDYDYVGFSVSSAGDINGDGFDDIIVNAIYPSSANDGYGSAGYIVFGKAGGWGATLELSTLNGSNGFALDITAFNDYTGESVKYAGDVNGDGYDDFIVGAYSTNPDGVGVGNAGVAYVVYGKASGWSPTLDLLALDGSDGFRLDGVTAEDYAGQSVSAAGDVNGDGFDDLVIGANEAPSGTGPGEAYVVFGGNFTGAVTYLGTAGNDTLTGTKASETFVGHRGNDIFIGNGGLDSFQGGAGSDTARLLGVGFRHIDGGAGMDTIRLDGKGLTFNLTTIPQSKIEGIERINIAGTGNNTLKLSVRDVLDLSDTSNTLIVNGNDGDVVHRGSGWTATGSVVIGANTFRVYEHGEATLLIDTDVTRVV